MEQTILTFNQVTKKYNKQIAVDNMSFTLPLGKMIGLVGPNGSGKSTMLKLMAGLLAPTQGTVKIGDELVNRLASRKVAFLADSETLYPYYSFERMARYFDAVIPDFQLDQSMALCDFLKIDRNKKLGSLSKGSKARVKIALTLARDVPIVLLDEPFSGIDPMARESIVGGLLRYIDLEKQTVVLSTHEVAETENLFDWVIALDQGRIMTLEESDVIREENGMSIVKWLKKQYA